MEMDPVGLCFVMLLVYAQDTPGACVVDESAQLLCLIVKAPTSYFLRFLRGWLRKGSADLLIQASPPSCPWLTPPVSKEPSSVLHVVCWCRDLQRRGGTRVPEAGGWAPRPLVPLGKASAFFAHAPRTWTLPPEPCGLASHAPRSSSSSGKSARSTHSEEATDRAPSSQNSQASSPSSPQSSHSSSM